MSPFLLHPSSGKAYHAHFFEQRPDSDVNNESVCWHHAWGLAMDGLALTSRACRGNRSNQLWTFTNKYWARRQTGDWAVLPDLYGKDDS